MVKCDEYTSKLFHEYIEALKNMRNMVAALDFTEAQCKKVEHLRHLLAIKGVQPKCQGGYWELMPIPPAQNYLVREKVSGRFWRTTGPIELTGDQIRAAIAQSENIPIECLTVEAC